MCDVAPTGVEVRTTTTASNAVPNAEVLFHFTLFMRLPIVEWELAYLSLALDVAPTWVEARITHLPDHTHGGMW